MKHITTILLTIFMLSCNAQEPYTHTYYTTDYVDSLNLRILELEYSLNLDSTLVNADTFKLNIEDGRLKIELKKECHNVWFSVIDDTSRYYFWFIEPRIEARYGRGNYQDQTWDIVGKYLKY